MRLGEVSNLFMTIGLFAVIIVLIILGLGYFILYKRLLKGKKQIYLHQIMLWGGFLSYVFIVIGATLIVRQPAHVGYRFNFRLFDQYHYAWHSFSVMEWRNIILNIIMFVPFGVMFPLLLKRLRLVWKIIFICFASSVAIEIAQLITGRGIFEFDDIFHNTLGAIIGYGLFCSVFTILNGRPYYLKKIFLGVIPLMITIATFIGIFAVYDLQEFGNMPQSYAGQVHISDIILTSEAVLSDEPAQAMVYATSGVASVRQTKAFAEEFFLMLGAEIDESRTQIYSESAFFEALSSTGQVLTLMIDYHAMTYRFFDSSSFDYSRRLVSEEVIRERLKDFQIYLSEAAIFSEEDEIHHFEFIQENDAILNYWGWLECAYYDDGTIKEINNYLVESSPLRMVDIISEKQAYEQIEKGMFHSSLEFRSLHVTSARLTYSMDTKGFLQPVYRFDVNIDGYEDNIIIPAYSR